MVPNQSGVDTEIKQQSLGKGPCQDVIPAVGRLTYDFEIHEAVLYVLEELSRSTETLIKGHLLNLSKDTY